MFETLITKGSVNILACPTGSREGKGSFNGVETASHAGHCLMNLVNVM